MRQIWKKSRLKTGFLLTRPGMTAGSCSLDSSDSRSWSSSKRAAIMSSTEFLIGIPLSKKRYIANIMGNIASTMHTVGAHRRSTRYRAGKPHTRPLGCIAELIASARRVKYIVCQGTGAPWVALANRQLASNPLNRQDRIAEQWLTRNVGFCSWIHKFVHRSSIWW